MKTQARKPVENTDQPSGNRCRYRTPTGRRRRAARSSPSSPFARIIAPWPRRRPSTTFAADLAARLKRYSYSLQSVEGVHDSLAELFILLAQDRVSPRRAAVLAHLSSLLLRTLPYDEADAEPEKPTVQFIFGRGPKPGVAPETITHESQLTEDCPGAFYSLRRDPSPKKGALSSEEQAIANFKAIST